MELTDSIHWNWRACNGRFDGLNTMRLGHSCVWISMKNSDFDEVGEADDLFFKPLLVYFGLSRLRRGPGAPIKANIQSFRSSIAFLGCS